MIFTVTPTILPGPLNSIPASPWRSVALTDGRLVPPGVMWSYDIGKSTHRTTFLAVNWEYARGHEPSASKAGMVHLHRYAFC